MAKLTKYFLRVRASGAVGPHELDSLRGWIEIGVISPNWKVCKEGDEAWISISEIPNFYDFSPQLRERLDLYRNRPREQLCSDPPTEKQLKKLRYFDIPFDATGLTKGRASELIESFISIDPDREEQYQSRPATAAQAKRIRSLGGDPADLTYCDAKDEIEELVLEKEKEEEEAEFTFDQLDFMLNDEDVREICKYKKLTKGQLQQTLAYLSQHVPDWRDRSRYDLGEFVPRLFPELVKGPRSTPRASRNSSKPKGCLGLLLLPACLLSAFLLFKVLIFWIDLL